MSSVSKAFKLVIVRQGRLLSPTLRNVCKHRGRSTRGAVTVGGMTAKSLRLADDIDLITTDEEEANENAVTI